MLLLTGNRFDNINTNDIENIFDAVRGRADFRVDYLGNIAMSRSTRTSQGAIFI
jgi:hypothetical protein